MIGLAEVVAVAATLMALLTWAGVALLAPRWAEGRPASPKRQLARARAWLHAPLWLPALLLAAAVAPGLLAGLLPGADHCLSHGAGHLHHLCFWHPPHAADGVMAWLLPACGLVPGLALLWICGRKVLREWRLTRSLVRLSMPSTLGPDIRLLDQTEPIALAVGVYRPTILLSRGLVEQVSATTLAAVVAHERAHVSRADTRAALMDRIAASLLPAETGQRLLALSSLAREQACDDLAAHALGSPILVAQALTQVYRLGLGAPPVGVAMATGAIEARVLNLLQPAPTAPRTRLWGVGAVVALLVVGAGPLHWAVEHLVTLLLH